MVKFIEANQLGTLIVHGFCAFHVSKKDRQSNHPDIDEIIHLLLDDSTEGRRIPAQLIENVEVPNGDCVSIYKKAGEIFIN